MENNQVSNLQKSNNLTPKQEKFAQLLGTSTITQSDAYRQVYNVSDSTNKSVWELASSLANDIKVRSRIDEIKAEGQAHLKYDTETHFRELEKLQKIAFTPNGKNNSVNLNAGLKAIELKGKLLGLYDEKQEIKYPLGISVQIVTSGTRAYDANTFNNTSTVKLLDQNITHATKNS